MGSVFARRVVRYGILSHQRSFLFRHIDSDVGNDCCRLSAARPFAIATALPVLIVAWILAFSVQHIGSFYGKMQTVQKWLNRIVGSIFAIIGLYYCVIMFGKYTMTSGDKDTTIAENIFKDYLKRFDCGIGWNRY